MKIVLCCIVSILFLNKINGQCDSVSFRNTATLISGVSLLDTSRILAVGDNGYVIKSTDGGKSWRNIKTYTPYFLKAIQLTSDSVGYTVGYYNTILKTEDQGESWYPLFADIKSGYTNISSAFHDLYFFNNMRGFIVGDGGKLVSTTDGGKTWRDTTFSAGRLNSVTFLNDSVGFIAGTQTSLYKTTNGGRTWQQITLSFLNWHETFLKVRFINTTTGFAVGYGGLCIKTSDGGVTWSKIQTPTSGVYYDIFFQNATKGFLVGVYSGALILQTDNGGNTWNAVFDHPGKYASFYCIGADPQKKKIIIAGGGSIGDFLGHNGRNIISSIDAGTTYKSLSGNGRLEYNDLFFLNDSTGYITGEAGASFKTSDYGESWKLLNNVPAYNGGNPAKRIFFLDTLNGYASSDNVYKTSDGGNTWVKTTTPGGLVQYNARQIYFFDALKGMVQDGESIYKTINAGTTWTKTAVSGNSFYMDLAATTNGKAIAVGYNGKAQISADEGTSWTALNLNTTKFLTAVYFYNNNTAYIGTADTTIFKTTDGGTTWVKINTGVAGLQVKSFHFVSDSIGYMMYTNNGATSVIYKTRNGGSSWYFFRQVTENLSRLGGRRSIYAAGDKGLIIKTDTLQKPGMAGYIYGPDKACTNTESTFITGKLDVNYTWSLSGGGSNVYKANLDTVLWNTPGLHTLSVSLSNACGVGPSRVVAIDVIDFKPVITVQDSILTATEGATYQWFRNGSVIGAAQGGTYRSLIARVDGNYTVEVKSLYGCTVTSPAVAYAGLPVKLCPNAGTSIISNITAGSYQWQQDVGAGFVNISDNTFYTGTRSKVLQIAGVPSSWYGYKYRCITGAGTSNVFAIKFSNSWTGAVSTAWEDVANWSCGSLPDANTDVIINSGNVIISSNVTIRTLTLNAFVNLAVQAGFMLKITH